jgi:hypothetical protein
MNSFFPFLGALTLLGFAMDFAADLLAKHKIRAGRR